MDSNPGPSQHLAGSGPPGKGLGVRAEHSRVGRGEKGNGARESRSLQAARQRPASVVERWRCLLLPTSPPPPTQHLSWRQMGSRVMTQPGDETGGRAPAGGPGGSVSGTPSAACSLQRLQGLRPSTCWRMLSTPGGTWGKSRNLGSLPALGTLWASQ